MQCHSVIIFICTYLFTWGVGAQEYFRAPIQSPLFQAVATKDLNRIKLLLQSGANPNEVWVDEHINFKHSLLNLAIQSRDSDAVQFLLQAGADPNKEIVNKTLKYTNVTADLHSKKQIDSVATSDNMESDYYIDNRSPLFFAIETNNPRMVKLLLDAGADPNRECSSPPAMAMPPLALAILSSPNVNIKIIELLLNAGADANWIPDIKKLMETDHMQNMDIPESMIFPSLLFVAIDTENTEVINLLLKAGADPNRICSIEHMQEAFTGPPLSLAVELENDDIVELLLQAGADPKQMCNYHPPINLPLGTENPDIINLFDEYI